MLDFLRQYSLPLFSLFLIAWSIFRMIKDKKHGKPVAKKAIIAVGVGVILIVVVAYMIIL